ncbi:MAG: PhzF family phenazine biosynthesis isomerase [Lachnospiraceae bacterium]|nr:PhzF family phenazine biosynthesis isomerase [Lachnospiraceae bacterium]
MKQYIVDAFTDKPFAGNPAAICIMESWPSKEFMMKLAMENNLSETAFVVKEPEGYHLRWFTPGTEVDVCGHATLAAAYVVLNYYEKDSAEVTFDTLSGKLKVVREGDQYVMDFPTYDLTEIPVTDLMAEAFGDRPIKALLGKDLVCVFESDFIIRTMKPNLMLLEKLPGRVQNATARGSETDCVSRSFCPILSIPEDPVCGSGHIQIASYWAEVLGKKEISGYQASRRGGYTQCELLDNKRMALKGKAHLFAVSEIMVEI